MLDRLVWYSMQRYCVLSISHHFDYWRQHGVVDLIIDGFGCFETQVSSVTKQIARDAAGYDGIDGGMELRAFVVFCSCQS